MFNHPIFTYFLKTVVFYVVSLLYEAHDFRGVSAPAHRLRFQDRRQRAIPVSGLLAVFVAWMVFADAYCVHCILCTELRPSQWFRRCTEGPSCKHSDFTGSTVSPPCKSRSVCSN